VLQHVEILQFHGFLKAGRRRGRRGGVGRGCSTKLTNLIPTNLPISTEGQNGEDSETAGLRSNPEVHAYGLRWTALGVSSKGESTSRKTAS